MEACALPHRTTSHGAQLASFAGARRVPAPFSINSKRVGKGAASKSRTTTASGLPRIPQSEASSGEACAGPASVGRSLQPPALARRDRSPAPHLVVVRVGVRRPVLDDQPHLGRVRASPCCPDSGTSARMVNETTSQAGPENEGGKMHERLGIQLRKLQLHHDRHGFATAFESEKRELEFADDHRTRARARKQSTYTCATKLRERHEPYETSLRFDSRTRTRTRRRAQGC